MHNEFTMVIEQDEEWFIGYCPEIPGANVQGHTVEECRENLAEAIALILEDRREDGLRGVRRMLSETWLWCNEAKLSIATTYADRSRDV